MGSTPLAEQFRSWAKTYAAARPPSKNMTRRQAAWGIFLRWLETQDERVDTWQEAMGRFVRYCENPRILADVLWLLQRQLDDRSAFLGRMWFAAWQLVENHRSRPNRQT